MAKAARRCGCVASRAATRKLSSTAKPTRCTSPRPASDDLIRGRAQSIRASVRPGDKILLSGPIGDHGITILLARGELDLEADLRSDTRSVFPLVEALVARPAPGIRWMRDPTRGGAATSLNELARDCGLGMVFFEDQIPVRDDSARRLRAAGARSAAHCERRPVPGGGFCRVRRCRRSMR